ncbi:MAG TPA: D-Ala-D-Ala carboxypeptidase family metallohydrolase [Limnobacter sp.]|nr:D-Ala-D-Ala carboxypeptidase family metallohydrolase [Limnobacter sp.]
MNLQSACNQKSSTCLSIHFSLADLTKTGTGLANSVSDPKIINNLKRIAEHILEPVQQHFKKRLIILSGYRSPAVSKAVNGSDRSQHSHGEAVDFTVPGHTVVEVANWIESNLVFDQLILEHFLPNSPNSGWVYCSYSQANRRNVLTKFKGSKIYHPGLLINPPQK